MTQKEINKGIVKRLKKINNDIEEIKEFIMLNAEAIEELQEKVINKEN